MSSKRPVKTSGDTPGKPKAKRSLTRGTRKSLFSHESEKKIPSLVPETNSEWTTKELQGLVQYIAFYNPLQTSNQWPTTKYKAFWSNCAEAVQQYSRKSIRTGNACRAKALRLKDKFSTIEEAEEKLNIDYFENEGEGIKQTSETLKTPKGYKCPESCLSPVFACSPSRKENQNTNDVTAANVIEGIVKNNNKLTKRQREQLLQILFTQYVQGINDNIPSSYVTRNFVGIVGRGISTLHHGAKENLFYHLGKCLEKTENGSTRMPLERMPFGLISHNLKFFSVDNAVTLKAPDDYKAWMETMYSRFGQSWAALHLGPMWSYEESSVENHPKESDCNLVTMALEESGLSSVCSASPETSLHSLPLTTCNNGKSVLVTSTPEPVQTTSSNSSQPSSAEVVARHSYSHLWANLTKQQIDELKDADVSTREVEEHFNMRPTRQQGLSVPKCSTKAKVNIAGPSAITIRRSIANRGFTKTTDIQRKALKSAHESNKKGRWWIKADATDVNKGLRESMKNVWSGDIDFGDGSLQKLHGEYLKQLKFIRTIGLKDRRAIEKITEDLKKLKTTLDDDELSLNKALDESRALYNAQVAKSNVPEQSLFALAWDLDGIEKLLLQNKKLHEVVHNTSERLARLTNASKRGNLAKELRQLREELETYTKGSYGKKREAASHLLVFMISDELRNFKPYAIPVRVTTYKSITDDQVQI